MLESFNDPVFLALILLVIIEALVIVILRREVRRVKRGPVVYGAGAGAAAGEESELASIYDQALTGSLDRFSVSEVIQFINTIRETGILDIVTNEGNSLHRAMVQEGEIIDAFNGDLRGEEAVARILQCTKGAFTFIRGDIPSPERTVNTPTMTLLMENFRKFDEGMAEVTLELEEGAAIF